MSQPPNTRSFRAWINLMPGSPSILVVTGEVETSASNNKPVLTQSNQSGSAGTLVLDLTIQNIGGMGTQAFQFWPVRFDRPAAQGEFSRVVILWDAQAIMTIPVADTH